jgi:hypothetical protein
VCASLFDEEANSLDKEKKPVDDSLPLASLAPIHETAVEQLHLSRKLPSCSTSRSDVASRMTMTMTGKRKLLVIKQSEQSAVTSSTQTTTQTTRTEMMRAMTLIPLAALWIVQDVKEQESPLLSKEGLI